MNNQSLHSQSAVDVNGGNHRVSLNHHVLATAKIGQILPILAIPCVPRDSFRVHSSCFTRTEPLPVPSFVKLNYRTLSVFVPYHQVFSGADSFFDNQKYNKGWTTNIPFFTIHDLYIALADAHFSENYHQTTEPNDFDYEVDDPVYRYIKVKARGKYAVKVLQLLGYNLQFLKDYRNNVTLSVEATNSVQHLSALPLLSFAHAYNTYMAYAPSYNTSALSKLIEGFARGSYTQLTSAQIITILSSILLTYEDSFFTTAWQQPFNSVPGSASLASDIYRQVVPPTDINSILTEIPELTTLYGADMPASSDITANSIRTLLRMDSYMRRSNFSGSKDIEQIYSRFGIKIEDYMTRYPHHINESASPVQIGDVTSTAHTEEAQVGSYAGKAICSDDASFKYEVKDYGMLFTFAWYAPVPSYYLGVDKEVIRLQPLDFYSPEFDDGTAAVLKETEVDARQDAFVENQDFGFVQNYAQYLFHQDRIVGRYRNDNGFDAWHFGRNDMYAAFAQTDKLIYMDNGGTPFERIFGVEDPFLNDVDTLYMTIQNDVDASRPMKDYTGKADLGRGNIDLPANGSNVN